MERSVSQYIIMVGRYAAALCRRVVEVHPAIYLILYLMLIPLFAGAYKLLAADFYHSGSKLDPLFQMQERKLAGDLFEFFKYSLRSHEQLAPPARLFAKDLVITEAESEPNLAIAFRLDFELEVKQEFTDGAKPLDFELHSFEPSFWKVYFHGREDGSNPRTMDANVIGLYPDLVRQLSQGSDVIAFNGISGTVKWGHSRENKDELITVFHGEWEMPERLYSDLLEYVATSRGQGSGRFVSYWRFFYFSGSTVTTLGIGDVVPVTDRARALVVVETILGVLVIGLFLTSLGARFSKSSGGRANQPQAAAGGTTPGTKPPIAPSPKRGARRRRRN